MEDMYNNLEVVQQIAPGTITSDTTSDNAVDLQGFNGALFVIEVGTVTDGTYDIEIQESDDDSSYSAVDDSDLQGDEATGIDGSGIYKIGYLGSKRYVQVSITASDTTDGADISAVAVKGAPIHAPV